MPDDAVAMPGGDCVTGTVADALSQPLERETTSSTASSAPALFMPTSAALAKVLTSLGSHMRDPASLGQMHVADGAGGALVKPVRRHST